MLKCSKRGPGPGPTRIGNDQSGQMGEMVIVILLHCAGRTHGMDGAHKRQRQTSDLVVGDEDEAGAKRQRVQNGVATAGRKGQATPDPGGVSWYRSRRGTKEVAKAMQAGSALVQASLEHLQTAERSWDTWVAKQEIR